MTYHYLKRLPTCLYSFGLFDTDELIGVIIYGRICSPGVVKSIVDEEFRSSLLELNRLCLKYNRKNEASYFISKTLKLIPKDSIVLSYADTNENHLGTIYQATNFKYYGTTPTKRECFLPGLEHIHSRSAFIYAKKYGLDIEYRNRSKKHRYIYATGNSKDFLYSLIKYEETSYPKGNL